MIVCLFSESQRAQYADELRRIQRLEPKVVFLDSIEAALQQIGVEKPAIVIAGTRIGAVNADDLVSMLSGENTPYGGPVLVVPEKSDDSPALIHSREHSARGRSSAEVIDVVEIVASIVQAEARASMVPTLSEHDAKGSRPSQDAIVSPPSPNAIGSPSSQEAIGSPSSPDAPTSMQPLDGTPAIRADNPVTALPPKESTSPEGQGLKPDAAETAVVSNEAAPADSARSSTEDRNPAGSGWPDGMLPLELAITAAGEGWVELELPPEVPPVEAVWNDVILPLEGAGEEGVDAADSETDQQDGPTIAPVGGGLSAFAPRKSAKQTPRPPQVDGTDASPAPAPLPNLGAPPSAQPAPVLPAVSEPALAGTSAGCASSVREEEGSGPNPVEATTASNRAEEGSGPNRVEEASASVRAEPDRGKMRRRKALMAKVALVALLGLGFWVLSRRASHGPSTVPTAPAVSATIPSASIALASAPAASASALAAAPGAGASAPGSDVSAKAPASSLGMSQQPSASASAPAGGRQPEASRKPLLVRDFPLVFQRSKLRPLLTSTDALKDIVAEIQRAPDSEIELIGHSSNDSDGEREVDIVFGRLRAEAAKKLLVQQGISADRIRVRSAGSDEPLVPNDSERNRSRNRRVVLQLYSR